MTIIITLMIIIILIIMIIIIDKSVVVYAKYMYKLKLFRILFKFILRFNNYQMQCTNNEFEITCVVLL
jgi:hypothetical protein